MALDRAEGICIVDSGEVKGWFLGRYKFPCCLFHEFLSSLLLFCRPECVEGAELTLLAVYAFSGFKASSQVNGAHLLSSYTFSCFHGFIIAADEDVITTRLTLGAYALIDLRIPVVPLMAGSRKSFTGSLTWKLYGEAVCTT